MTLHIDVGTVLRTTVCDLYSNLVTRTTGAAVRIAIEKAVMESGAPVITTIDFSRVNLLDFSCADEIVAKLLLRYAQEEDALSGYVLFRGIQDAHLDPIEAVLERRKLALVSWHDSGATVLGSVSEGERYCWQTAYLRGPSRSTEIADLLGSTLASAEERLELLVYRRLLMFSQGIFTVPGASLSTASGPEVL